MLCDIGVLLRQPPLGLLPHQIMASVGVEIGLSFLFPWAKCPIHLLLPATSPPWGQCPLLEAQTWP